jgi:glyoxylase-like metal-dependent hydrolase (beta-lactamase superfamily II)
MIEQIAASLYRVEVPLPLNPLKSINSYFIKSPDRNLIIDTGMNLPECREALLSAITRLEIDLRQTDFFITHFHIDHLELAPHLATRTSKIYLNNKEAAMLYSPRAWETYCAFFLKYGFPENELQQMQQSSMAQAYRSGGFKLGFTGINDKDVLEVGDYSLLCIETAGHSPGHICLYEPVKKILISGDHVLFDITPNITSAPGMENALDEYSKNLDKIYPLEVNLVLPGHRSIQSNHRKRILELKEHHRTRANEILAVLDQEAQTAFQIAPRVTWDVSYSSWEQFPIPQKFFALGEVVAHLKFLEEEGVLRSMTKNDQIVFSRNYL